MGPEFLQIWGGTNGAPLGDLADQSGSNKINIPVGSVIVTDGHAALYTGNIKVDDQWELTTYDANDQTGWTVSVNETPSKSDQLDRMAAFPGHRVGEHVSRLQWGDDHLVKVFQPIGNHPVAPAPAASH